VVDLGVIVILGVLAAGLIWLLVRALKGKEVERRVVFAFILVAVASPLLVKMTFKFEPTPIVRALYDKLDGLPEGSKVLISFDFDPAMAPEVQPMANVLTRHAMVKNHKVIFMCLFATGSGQLNVTLEDVMAREFPEKVDGIDYVNLGYKAGNEGVLNVIATDFKKMYPTDVNTVPWDSIPILDGIKSCKELDFIISIGGGRPGIKEWVLFVTDPIGVPTAAGVAAVVAPQLYPYYPRQLLGILGGVKGAAEYETRFKKNYPQYADMAIPATEMMGPQTIAHIVIMAFIVIGNVLYFRTRKKGPSA
jgi:hypothetical protein